MLSLIILISAFLIFLFCVYLLSREDYIFLRENISLEKIFNVTFSNFFLALFFARLFFVIFHWRFVYTNPLVFFIFPYFPGLSLPGAILGVFLSMWVIVRKWQIPLGRMFDIFAVSFLATYTVTNFLTFISNSFTLKHIQVFNLATFAVVSIGFIFSIVFFRTNKWKDGLIGLSVMLVFSLVTLIKDIFFLKHMSVFILRDELLYIVIFIFSLLFIIRQSNTFDKKRRT